MCTARALHVHSAWALCMGTAWACVYAAHCMVLLQAMCVCALVKGPSSMNPNPDPDPDPNPEQEQLVGEEWVVDTVSRAGEHKVCICTIMHNHVCRAQGAQGMHMWLSQVDKLKRKQTPNAR